MKSILGDSDRDLCFGRRCGRGSGVLLRFAAFLPLFSSLSTGIGRALDLGGCFVNQIMYSLNNHGTHTDRAIASAPVESRFSFFPEMNTEVSGN